MIYFHLNLLILAIIIVTVDSLYDEKPSYVFQVFDRSMPKSIIRSFLSINMDELIIFYSDLNDSPFLQEKYDFNGTKVCQRYLQATQKLISWPLKTQGIYINPKQSGKISKTDQNCGIPTQIITLPQKYSYTFRNLNQSSYITVLTDNKTVNQYNLKTGNFSFYLRYILVQNKGILQRNFTLKPDQLAYQLSYTKNSKFLFVQTKTQVIVFDGDSFERIRQIPCDLKLRQGDSDGKGFIAYVPTGNDFYHLDQDGFRTLICKNFIISDNYPLQVVYGVCTDQNILVSIHQSADKSYRLITFDGKQRNIIQNFSLGSMGLSLSFQCNNKYMQITDENGYSYIFKYNKPEPNPDDENDSSLPIWAVVIIIIGSVLIIGSSIAICIRKRKSLPKGYQNLVQ